MERSWLPICRIFITANAIFRHSIGVLSWTAVREAKEWTEVSLRLIESDYSSSKCGFTPASSDSEEGWHFAKFSLAAQRLSLRLPWFNALLVLENVAFCPRCRSRQMTWVASGIRVHGVLQGIDGALREFIPTWVVVTWASSHVAVRDHIQDQ